MLLVKNVGSDDHETRDHGPFFAAAIAPQLCHKWVKQVEEAVEHK